MPPDHDNPKDGWGELQLSPYVEMVWKILVFALPAFLIWLFVRQGEYFTAVMMLFIGPYFVTVLFSRFYKPTHCPKGHTGSDIVWRDFNPSSTWICLKCRRQRLRKERSR